MAGSKIAGKVTRVFKTDKGEACSIQLTQAVELEGEKQREVSIGGMKGFIMALQTARCNGLALNPAALLVGDLVHIEATGSQPPKQEGHSPMICFAVEITRSGKVYKGRTEDASAPFLGSDFWGV